MRPSITITGEGSKFSPILLIGDHVTQIERAAQYGFSNIEMHICNPNNIDAEQILSTSRDLGINISTIGTGQAYVDEGLSFTSNNHQVYTRAIKRIKEQIELANYFDAIVIIGTVRGLLPEEKKAKGNAQAQVLQALKECGDYAEKFKVKLSIEAINRYEMNHLNTADETLEFLSLLNKPNVGLHLDTFHMNIEERDMVKAILKGGSKLFHVHLADSNRLAPGWGHINFGSLIDALKKINYKGTLGFEYTAFPDSKKASKQGKNLINRLI